MKIEDLKLEDFFKIEKIEDPESKYKIGERVRYSGNNDIYQVYNTISVFDGYMYDLKHEKKGEIITSSEERISKLVGEIIIRIGYYPYRCMDFPELKSVIEGRRYFYDYSGKYYSCCDIMEEAEADKFVQFCKDRNIDFIKDVLI